MSSYYSRKYTQQTGALLRQQLPIPLFVGQNSSIDPRIQPVGTSPVVENGSLYYQGQVRARDGFPVITNTTIDGVLIDVGRTVFSGGGALFMMDASAVYARSTAANSWVPLGSMIGGALAKGNGVPNSDSVVQTTSANSDKYHFMVWSEGSTTSPLYCTLVDSTTGVTVLPKIVITPNGKNPVAVQLNGDFYIFWGDLTASAPLLKMAVVRENVPTAIAYLGTLAPIVSSECQFDVCIDALFGTGFLLAAEDGFNGSSPANVIIGAWSVTTAGVCTEQVTAVTPFDTHTASGVTTQPNCLRVPQSGAIDQYGAIAVNNALLIVSATSPVSFTIDPIHRATAEIAPYAAVTTIFFEFAPHASVQPYTISFDPFVGYTLAPARPLPITMQGGIYLTSRAFAYQYNTFVWAVLNEGVQSLYVCLNALGDVVAISGANGEVAGFDGFGCLSSPTDDGTGSFPFIIRTIQAVTDDTTITKISAAMRVLMVSGLLPYTYAQQFDGITYMGNCAPQIYDGVQMTEWGFYGYPQIIVGSGPGALNGGTYIVSACYSWTDATGKIWRSTTSFTQTVFIGAANGIRITYPNLWLTSKKNVNIEFYCSANIGGQSGSVMYLVGSVRNSSTGFFASQPTGSADGVFNITQTDDQIATGELLYTSGGAPDNLTAPSMNHMSSSGLRLYACAPEDQQVYVTSPATPSQPLNFLLTQSVALEARAGGILGSQPQDGILWIATQHHWYQTNADTTSLSIGTVGQGGNVVAFIPPAQMDIADGCVSGPSILAAGGGIYYQSTRGIECITRNAQFKFIGEAVKNFNTPVLSAYIVPSVHQIRFQLLDRALCYDTERDTWLQHVYGPAPQVYGACAWNKLGIIIDPNGKVYQETPGTFTDGAEVPITVRVQTPWARVGGTLGTWGKLWDFVVLGEQQIPTAVSVKLAYNDDPTWIDTLTIPSTTGLGDPYGDTRGVGQPFGMQGPLPKPFGNNPAGNAWKWLGIIPRADNPSVRFELSFDTSVSGEGIRLNEITLIYGTQPNSQFIAPIGRQFG